LSAIGCLFIIISFLCIKATKIHYELVFCLAISQLIIAINGIAACTLAAFEIIVPDRGVVCYLQSCSMTIGQKSGWMYVSYISFNMVALSRGHSNSYMKNKRVWIHLFGWVLVNAGFIGGLWDFFGKADSLPFSMCWTTEGMQMLFALYIPMGVFGAFNAGCIAYIAGKYIHDLKQNKEVRTNLLTARSQTKVYLFLLRISFYPCIFLLVAASMTVGRLLNRNENNQVWTQYLIQSVFLEGFFCAIAYGFTPSLRIRYAKFYRERISTNPPSLEDAWSSASPFPFSVEV
jgi:hypothetical protein